MAQGLLLALATLPAGMALAGAAQAQSQDVLPDIPFGNIAVKLNPVATGLSAPAYATFAPGVADKLFVVEQNGLLRVLQNGSLLPGAAMDISARVAPPPGGRSCARTASSLKERGNSRWRRVRK